MVAVQVTRTIDTDGGLLSANIDGIKLTFVNDVATKNLASGIEYTLQWFVMGGPGAKYSIAISKPTSVNFKHSAVLDDGGKDAGIFWFTLKEDQ